MGPIQVVVQDSNNLTLEVTPTASTTVILDRGIAGPVGPAGPGDVDGPASSTDNAVARFNGTTGKLIQNSLVTIADDGTTVINVTSTTAALQVTQAGTGNALLIEDATTPDATPLIVNQVGQLVVGYTAAIGAGQNTNIQSQATGGTAGVSAFRWSNDITPPRLQVGKSRNATIGSYTIVQSGDQLGGLYFYGDDGTDLVSQGAAIICEVDGTPGLNDMPGRLIFSTTSDGSQSPTSRVTIDNTGQTTFSYNAVISVSDATNAALRITQTGVGNALLVEDIANPDSTPFVIDSNGRVIQGYTTALLTVDDYNGTLRTGWGIQGNNTNAAGALFTTWNASATVGAGISLSRSKSATIGTQGIVLSGDSLGGIGFNGDDGASFISAASISCEVDGTPGLNDMPGRLLFNTTADGASTPTERMRIDSAGNVQAQTGAIVQWSPAPASISAAATLTTANIQAQIVVTTGTTFTLTMPTGSDLDSLINWATNDIGYDFSVINTASSTVTMAANTGVTIVGRLTILTSISARFRIRRTAASTYIMYRLS